MSTLPVRRLDIKLLPDTTRVIIRPFIPGSAAQVTRIIGRTLALSEEEVETELQAIREDFGARHPDLDGPFLQRFEKINPYVFTHRPLTLSRQLLLGAVFSGEYSLEASALFNPSIVPHPDQSDIPEGGLRFILSLRATGEGHISSIEFRVGEISPQGDISLLPVSRYVAMPEILPNPRYKKSLFAIKLHEMGYNNECDTAVLDPLNDQFTRNELMESMRVIKRERRSVPHEHKRTMECIEWLADSNYELRFPERLALSERIIFPVSMNESNGIEDARFVRFTEDDGAVTYYATYTAYNGHVILPQLIETEDFLNFRVLTLNGDAAQNKGMALFPRRIHGRYAMLSRQDDENILIMFSDNPHYWSDPQMLLRPAEPWETVKMGNCGSPIETSAGWLVITHGVGPMRKYCIGAALLDLDDPTQIIGRLRKPLLFAEGAEREGYVPNVVYSCGSLIHNGQLILPYAMSDTGSTMATVPLDKLLEALQA